MKGLLVTFSNNSDHQDTLFGLYEELEKYEDVTLLAIDSPKVDLAKSENTWLINCPKNPGICYKTFDFVSLWFLIRRIKKNKFDYIYFESLHVWNLPITIFSNKTTKVYQVIHEVVPHEGDRNEKNVDFMNKIICKFVDIIILRNQKYKSEMIRRYCLNESKVKFLELWRRFDKSTPPKYNKRVLFFGRINPYKGANNLLEIVKYCPTIQFDVIGRVDPSMSNIAELLKNENNVNFNDKYVSDREMVSAFMNAAWIILPYNSASQSGVIIDAYKYSRPVIAYNVGAIYEQVIDGSTGYLVEPFNNRIFSETLKKAVNLPNNIYKNMCENSYNFGYKKYSVKTGTISFWELIKNG